MTEVNLAPNSPDASAAFAAGPRAAADPQFLEAAVVGEFKTVLLMTEAEELAMDQSFFEMGLTSLMLTDVKQRLETVLGFGIDASEFFNRPTVEQLLEYLGERLAR